MESFGKSSNICRKGIIYKKRGFIIIWEFYTFDHIHSHLQISNKKRNT